MKVIALISGGKDSLFSILHCLAHGHEIVALANLHPAPSQDEPVEEAPLSERRGQDGRYKQDELDAVSEDIDSYMYQTIGHHIVALYAEALGLPLYRQPILGRAVITDKTYVSPPSPQHSATGELDETESLIPLLRTVLAAHPSATALSSGAILSSYQRTRIESVAARLGLTPLAFLWQYPLLPPYAHASLLHDMAAAGQDARVVKVASAGLGVDDLWRNIADPAVVSRLRARMARFGGLDGGALLGEGGEYETLAVDGPKPLWKKRIAVGDADWRVVSGEGGVGVVRVLRARVVQKTEDEDAPAGVRIPELLDKEFARVLKRLQETTTSLLAPVRRTPVFQYHELPLEFTMTTVETSTTLHLSNIHYPTLINSTTATQTAAILAHVRAFLATHSLAPAAILFTTILLRRMSDFPVLNALYSALFADRPNPPARVTVACGAILPADTHVVLSLLASKLPASARRALHVQSRSYWAPANIGPYSQAVAVRLISAGGSDADADADTDADTSQDDVASESESVGTQRQSAPELCYVAGQIPLRPAEMEIVDGGFAVQTVLALQHLWRVGREMNVACWAGGLAFVVGASKEEVRERAVLAGEAWRLMHDHRETHSAYEEEHEEEGNDVDIADRQLYGAWATSHVPERQVFRRPIPDPCLAPPGEPRAVPPMFTLEVAELPRAAQIEWAARGLCCSRAEQHRTGCCVPEARTAFVYMPLSEEELCSSIGGGSGGGGGGGDMRHGVERLTRMRNGCYSEVFTSRPAIAEAFARWSGAMVVPCRSVWTVCGREVHGVLRTTYTRGTSVQPGKPGRRRERPTSTYASLEQSNDEMMRDTEESEDWLQEERRMR